MKFRPWFMTIALAIAIALSAAAYGGAVLSEIRDTVRGNTARIAAIGGQNTQLLEHQQDVLCRVIKTQIVEIEAFRIAFRKFGVPHAIPHIPGEGVRLNCPGDAVIIGDNKANTIHGTDDPDFIDARGGNDRVYGNNGDDTIFGGTGKDRLEGNFGDRKST